MPRVADHDARRDQISAAAIDLALAEGIARVTVARVAERAGVSVGLVQHYFSSKHALMTRVYAELLDRADDRVADVVARGEAGNRSIRDMTVDALCELLPLDEARMKECLIRAELETQAARDPARQRVAAGHARALRARLSAVVTNGTQCGETPHGTDADRAAARMWATVTGAGRAQLLDPDFPSRAVLTSGVGEVFSQPCCHHR